MQCPWKSLTWSTLTCSLQISNSKSQTLRRHFSKDKAEVSVKTQRVLSRFAFIEQNDHIRGGCLLQSSQISHRQLLIMRLTRVQSTRVIVHPVLSDAPRACEAFAMKRKHSTLPYFLQSALHTLSVWTSHICSTHTARFHLRACKVSEVNYGTNGIFAMVFECL